MLDELKTWIPIVLSVYSGVYVTQRLFKRNETKEKIEYFEKKAADLEKRYAALEQRNERLEAHVARYRMANDYYVEALGPTDPVVMTAQSIISGKLNFKDRKTDKQDDGNIDITEARG